MALSEWLAWGRWALTERTQSLRAPSVATLEPRVLLSAAPIDVAADDAGGAVATASVDAASLVRELSGTTRGGRELLVIDRGLPEVDELLRLLEETRSDREVLWVDRGDTLRDVTEGVSEYGDDAFTAVHVVTHGRAGAFELGGEWVTASSVEGRATEWAAWGDVLRPGGDLLIYGCEVTASGDGLIRGLAALTGVDVAGSTDLTGGGPATDWVLETTVGAVEAQSLSATGWGHTLTTQTFNADVADTYIEQDDPDHNHGGQNKLVINATDGVVHQGLIRFDRLFASAGGPIPDNAEIISATLELRVESTFSDPALLRAHDLFVTFDEDASAEDFPAGLIRTDDVDASSTGSVPTVAGGGSTVEFDVRDAVQRWSLDGSPIGLLIAAESGGETSVHSSDDLVAANRPKLSVEWADEQVITVTTATDEMDGDVDSPVALAATPGGTGVSLREALTAAAGTTQPVTIGFALGAGTHTLTVSDAFGLLPDVVADVTIDGTTSVGYSGDPLVTIAGDAFGGGGQNAGLTISGEDVTVRGVAIAGFRNGVIVDGPDAVLVDNWIGLSAEGVRQTTGSGSGVLITSSGTTVGRPGEGNRIAAFSNTLDASSNAPLLIRGNAVENAGTGFRINGKSQSLDRPDSDGIQNDPVVSSVRRSGGTVEIDVQLHTTPGAAIDLDLLEANLAGTRATGTFVASQSLTADTNGRLSYTFVLPDIGQVAFSAQASDSQRSSTMAIARAVPRSERVLDATLIPPTDSAAVSLAGGNRGSASSIAALPDGRWFTVWTESEAGTRVVYGRRIGVDGLTTDPKVRISDGSADATHAVVGADAAGRLTVAWSETGSGEIKYRRVTPVNATATILTVAASVGERLTQPSLDVLPTGEFVIAATSREDTPAVSSVVARYYHPNGAEISRGLIRLSNSPPSGTARESAVAMNRDGVAVVAHKTDGGLRYSVLDIFAAAPVTTFDTLLTAGSKSHDAVAHADGRIDLVFLKQDLSGNDQVHRQTFSADGSPVGGVEVLTDFTLGDRLDDLSAAASENGALSITFVDRDAATVRVVAVDATGRAGDPVFVAQDSGAGRTNASVAFAPGSDIARVVWEGADAPGQGDSVYSREYVARVSPADDHYSVTEGQTLDTRGDWFDDSYEYRRRITIADRPEGTVADAPVLVRLDATFDYASAMPDGSDVTFVDSSGTQLAHEIEAWNVAGESRVWVRLPALTTDGTDYFDLYYGRATASATVAGSVWDDDTVGVYHFVGDRPNEDAAVRLDGAQTLTNNGTAGTAGVVGNGRWVNPGASMTLDNVPFLSGVGEATVSGWFYADTVADSGTFFGVGVGDGSSRSRLTLGFEGGSDLVVGAVAPDSDADSRMRVEDVFDQGQWVHLTTTMDYAADELAVFVDGTEVFRGPAGVTAGTTDAVNSARVEFGSGEYGEQDFDGRFDEIRVAHVARSADWVSLQHASMSGGLLTVGGEESFVDHASAAGGSLLANDGGDTGLLSIAGIANGDVTITADGHFTFTPAPGFVGVDVFDYSLDGRVARVFVNVLPDTATTHTLGVSATPAAVTTDEGVPLTFGAGQPQSLSVNATDADSAVTVRLTPSGGRLTLGSTAGLSGTLGPGTDGQELVFTGTAAAVNAALDGLVFEDAGDGSAFVNLQATQTDEFGENHVGAAIVEITVNDVPELTAGVSHTGGNEAEDIVFSAAPTTGGLGPLQYFWDIGDDGSVEGTGQAITFDGTDLNDPDTVVARLTVRDTRGETSSTLYTVEVQNTPPNLPDITATLGEDEQFRLDRADIEAIISDAADPLELINVTLVSGSGDLQLTANRLFYRPRGEFAHLSDGETGLVELAYHVREQTEYTGRILLTYVGVDEAPNARRDQATIDEDTSVTLNVLANDSDAEGHAMSVELLSGPSFGTAELLPDGRLTYTPDANASGVETLRYRVTANGKTDAAQVVITVTPVDDPPVVTADDLGVREFSPAGTFAGRIFVSDPDDSSPEFSIAGGPDAGLFAIDKETGELTTVADLNGIDTSVRSAFELTVRVRSGAAVVDEPIVVKVLAGNAAPSLPAGSFVVDENTSGALAFVPTAVDREGGPLTYALTDDGGLPLAIDAGTGEVTLTAPLDHEATGPRTVTIRVSDGTNTVERAYDFVVRDLPERPVFADVVLSVSEARPVGGLATLTASDPDGDGPIAFELVDDDGGPFTVGPAGDLRLTGPLDFESRSDYRLLVRAVDASGMTRNAVVTVRVGDAAESPSAADQAFVVSGSVPLGSTIGFFAASDPDAGEVLEFTLVEDAGLFRVDGASGRLFYAPSGTSSGPPSGIHEGRFRVTDSSGLSVERAFSVRFDSQNGPLRFADQTLYVVESSTANVSLGTLRVDGGAGPVTFELVGGSPAFRLANDGIIANAPLDHEDTASHTLRVRATSGSESAVADVRIVVIDVNEPVVKLSNVAESISVDGMEVEADLRSLLAGTVIDPESERLFFTLVDGPDVGVVTVESSGDLSFTTAVMMTADAELVVAVSDGSTDPVMVTVVLEPVLATPPEVEDTTNPGAETDEPAVPGNPSGVVVGAVDVAVTDTNGETSSPDDSRNDGGTGAPDDTTTDGGTAEPDESSSPVVNAPASEAPVVLGPQTSSPTISDAQPGDTLTSVETDDSMEADGLVAGADAFVPDFESLAEFDTNGIAEVASLGDIVGGRQLSVAPMRDWAAGRFDPDSLTFDLMSFAGVSKQTTLAELNQVRNDLSSSGLAHSPTQHVVMTIGTSFTVGYVLWTVRGGFLLTGLLAQIPAWRVIDPLSILDEADGERGGGESLESMLDQSNGPALAT